MAGSLASLGLEDTELKGLMSDGASTVKAIKILKAEGCFAVVMEKTMISCSKTVLKWAQEVVRNTLLDVDESLLQPTLLDHCKALLVPPSSD